MEQFTVVRIKKINKAFRKEELFNGERLPEVGDVATIVEIYEEPNLGYELECCNENGGTVWLMTFHPEDAEFEIVATNT